MKGILKTLNSSKGFGFIAAGEKDYFFHRSAFNGHWNDLVDDFSGPTSQRIYLEFELGESSKGPRAENVKRLDWPNKAV